MVQCDALNRSKIATIVCVPLTTNLRWRDAPGNVFLEAEATGLPEHSVANVSQVISIDKSILTERAGKLSAKKLGLWFAGIDVVLGRFRQ